MTGITETISLTKCVLIPAASGVPITVDLDVSVSAKNADILRALGNPKGTPTFIGKWVLDSDFGFELTSEEEPDEIILMKLTKETADVLCLAENEYTLPSPFENETVFGNILLVKMNFSIQVLDFTVEEYKSLFKLN